jgi:hypothetical protein
MQKRLVLLLAALAIVTTNCSPGSWNDQSRMATIQSLVESGSFVIDHSAFLCTGDKVFINQHFYSDKPPMPSLLGAIVYLPLYHLGARLHLGRSIAYYLVTLLTVKVFWLCGTVAFFRALRFTGLDAQRRFLASLALGVGSLYFSWSATFNNHVLAGSFLSIGFYFLLKARHENRVARDLGWAGLFLSLAGTADMPTGIFYALFIPYIVRDTRLRAGIIFYVLPILVTLVPALAINYSIHHSIVPVQIVRSYFEYPGSPWLGSDNLSGMRANDTRFVATYSMSMLIGAKGFLLYDPFLFIAIWGLVHAVRQKGAFMYEGLVIGSGSLAIVAYYVMTTNNFGGEVYSIRWLVPLLPLLLFFLYPYFERYEKPYPRGFAALLGVSTTIALIGAFNPWSSLRESDVPLIANIKQIDKFQRDVRHHTLPITGQDCER